MSTVTTFLNLVKPAPLEQFSRATYNTNLDLIDAGVLNADRQAKGYMPQSKTRASASAPTTTIAVIDNIESFTFKANRRYRISWNCSYTQSVATDYFDAKIQTCSTADASNLTTGLTELIGRSCSAHSAGAGQPLYVEDIRKYVADTTLQIKFTVARTLGTGNWTMEAKRSLVTIEDLGYEV